MIKPTISIITVVYNAKDALEATIENIKELKYENIEYIVVDGDSNDGTKEVIEKNHHFISKWISKKDEGIYDAMNKGLEMAEGEYVWFINAGDFVCNSDVLNNIFSGFENLADIYYGDTMILSEDGVVKGLRKKKLPRRLSLNSFKRGMVVCHQSFIVKKSITPLYNLEYKYSADIEWVMECTSRARSIKNTRLILSKFVEGGTSTKHRKESLEERFKIMSKYYGPLRTSFYHIFIIINSLKPQYRRVKIPF